MTFDKGKRKTFSLCSTAKDIRRMGLLKSGKCRAPRFEYSGFMPGDLFNSRPVFLAVVHLKCEICGAYLSRDS